MHIPQWKDRTEFIGVRPEKPHVGRLGGVMLPGQE